MVHAKYVRYLVKNVLFKCMEIHIFYHSSNGSNYFSSSIKLKYKAHLRVFVTKCCSFGTHKEPYCKWAIFSTAATLLPRPHYNVYYTHLVFIVGFL